MMQRMTIQREVNMDIKYNTKANSTKLLILSSVILLSGCATFSKDGGLDGVKQITQRSVKQDIAWPKSKDEQSAINQRVAELRKQKLDVESAVQIALLNNKGLQASLYELGIAESDVIQAGRLPNPRFSMFWARNGGEYNIEQALTFNIFSLITMPRIKKIERQRFELTKQQTAYEVVRLAYETRQAYFNALAAAEQTKYSEQVKGSAEASAELARRMVKAGNFNKLEQAREQSFYADAALDFASAKNRQNASYEALARLLGLSINDFVLKDRLPDLPKSIEALQTVEKNAFEQRLDLLTVRNQNDVLAKQLGLTKTTRFINVLELGPARVLEGRRGEDYKNGVDISFEIPLFDWGTARVARAESIYMQSVNRAAQVATNAQSEIRSAYYSYRTSYDIAKHYRDEIVPLRKKILDENQLRYNGMLVGPFELLAEARAQVSSVKNYIDALREFWVAESTLQMSLIGSHEMKAGE
jgi:outer membrane protein TolC